MLLLLRHQVTCDNYFAYNQNETNHPNTQFIVWHISFVICGASINPLTTGAVNIRFLHFILRYYISAFKPVKN